MTQPTPGEIIKVDNDKRQVFGWAYICYDRDGSLVIDKSGEFVDDVEELEKAAYNFVLRSRQGGAFHARTPDGSAPIVKSTLVESVVFTPEKISAMGLPPGAVPQGWWIGYQVHDDEVWNMVKSGTLTSFSIHGKGTKKEVHD